MKKVIIIKYGELSTKKDNINYFLSCLKDNIMNKYISIEKYLENKDNFKINNNYLKILEYILIIICLIIFSISIYNIIIWNIDNIKIHKLSKKINTSINLSNDVIFTKGNGSYEDPYIVK